MSYSTSILYILLLNCFLHVIPSNSLFSCFSLSTRALDDKPQTKASKMLILLQYGFRSFLSQVPMTSNTEPLGEDFRTTKTTSFSYQIPGDSQPTAFDMTNYAPKGFHHIRSLFGLQNDDFLSSMCDNPLRQVGNPGQSGAQLFSTNDYKFFIKTILFKEVTIIQNILEGYYKHLNEHPETLLPIFLALFTYEAGGDTVHLVVMFNLFPPSITINQKFDIKGATHERMRKLKAKKSEKVKKVPTFRDPEFKKNYPQGIQLEPEIYKALMGAIHSDCDYLERSDLLDYSLLLGVRVLGNDEAAKRDPDGGRVFHESRNRWMNGTPAKDRGTNLILYMGLIDITMTYGSYVKFMDAMALLLFDGGYTLIQPRIYSARLTWFLRTYVFKEDPSTQKKK